MRTDRARLVERATVDKLWTPRDHFREVLLSSTVHKYDAEEIHRRGLLGPDGRALSFEGCRPKEIIEGTPFNLLMYGGASAFFDLLIGAGNVTAFNNANAYLGVGSSNTAAAATQTDLQGASKNRQGQEATYPSHTDGTGSGAASCVWKSQWGSADGNFAWEEWALFNAAAAGRMLQRKVESFGTKSSGAVWTLTTTLSLA